MKRYDLFSECLCGVGFEPLCEESTDGSWVDADIAQEMYDALEDILAFIPDEDHGFSCLGIALEKGHEALEKANKG